MPVGAVAPTGFFVEENLLDINAWTGDFCEKLQSVFGRNLLFVGLQGSYKRGEATQNSDIDMVVVLNECRIQEIKAYGETVKSMPFSDKACGFVCSAEVLRKWPRFDVLNLYFDTKPIIGRLEDFIDPFSQKEIRESLVFGASCLYHGAVHALIFDQDYEAQAAALSKAAFFVIRLRYYLKTGKQTERKTDILVVTDEQERLILQRLAPAETVLTAIAEWSEKIITETI